jgi:hypothetical protein
MPVQGDLGVVLADVAAGVLVTAAPGLKSGTA